MLFYTGIRRTAETVAKSYVDDIKSKRRQLRLMKDLTDEAVTILNSGVDLKAFGFLLHEAWEAKRSLSSQVSNSDVDDIYEIATATVRPEASFSVPAAAGSSWSSRRPNVTTRSASKALVYVPFRFEFGGSQVIFMDREQDYLDIDPDAASGGFRELDPDGDPAAGRDRSARRPAARVRRTRAQ